MAAKRCFDDSISDSRQPNQKKLKTRHSFSAVIGEVVMVNFLQKLCSAMEPMLRRVVRENVEQGLKHYARSLSRSSSLRIQASEPSSLKLVFSKELSLPIFTAGKIVDIESNPIQILLVDTTCDEIVPSPLPSPIKVEIVVLDGDFNRGGLDTWTSEEFERNIVRERTGKRPLLTGELQLTMRGAYANLGDIEFTDNSSWIRSRKFRLGARVVQETCHGVRIREAMTESFVVKDHRGELYKKHHPPMLEDEVWRLEKIGKEGAFHKKLASHNINTVQDFLKLSVVDPGKLRKILGVGMPEKMWEVAVKHAKTCVMGNKHYISCGHNYTIILNPICQVVRAEFNGQIYPARELTSINRAYLEGLVRDAYANWNMLEEFVGDVNETGLPTQGDMVDQYPNQNQSFKRQYQQHPFISDGTLEVDPIQVTAHEECNEWANSTYIYGRVHAGAPNASSESSSDGDLTPSRSFMHGN